MIVGGYQLDLYCDGEHPPYDRAATYTFTGWDRAQARKAARKAGWSFAKDGKKTYCPSCSKIAKKQSKG